MNGDPEHLEAVEQVVELGSPLGELDDVFDDDIVAGDGSVGVAAARKQTGLDELIAAEQQKRDAQASWSRLARVDFPELDAPLRMIT